MADTIQFRYTLGYQEIRMPLVPCCARGTSVSRESPRLDWVAEAPRTRAVSSSVSKDHRLNDEYNFPDNELGWGH